MPNVNMNDNDMDQGVDDEIANCLCSETRKSFFLFAGAGSGKTRSLVKALNRIQLSIGAKFYRSAKQIAVVTYTNKARDEILERLGHNPLFVVATIHSFSWQLIQGFNKDISDWLRVSLEKEISDLEIQEKKGKQASDASKKRKEKIIRKTKRLEQLDNIEKFVYSPDSENSEMNALSHNEVISICADFLNKKNRLRDILTSRYPIFLIDESQDTKKELINALMDVQKEMSTVFTLGLFGDMMQRIYNDGEPTLGNNLPNDWSKPAKKMNHRSKSRIVELINQIRKSGDGREQYWRTDKVGGSCRIFLLPSSTVDKPAVEGVIMKKMADITKDNLWTLDTEVKTLMLEHRMAAARLGFFSMFKPLQENEKLKTGLLKGNLSGLKFFSDQVLPILCSKKNNDSFSLTSTLRKHSPLLSSSALEVAAENSMDNLKKADDGVNALQALWKDGASPSFNQVLHSIKKSGLLNIPESLNDYISLDRDNSEKEESEEGDEIGDAWRYALSTPFDQIELYKNYVNGLSKYDTHQGVKGLEFPRVCVLIDDTDSRHAQFKYEKLFSENSNENSDSSIRRLFYVVCSRATESLAIIFYTENPEFFAKSILEKGWFSPEEVICEVNA